MSIYLDYAAATPVDPGVLEAMQPYFSQKFHNPSAIYGPAVEASNALEHARSSVAEVVGAKSSEIIFTAGGTEANNLAIHGIMQRFPDAELLVSAIEHDSVRSPAAQHIYKEIPVSEHGLVDPNNLKELITDSTVLVSVMYANNEIGTVQPLRRIAAVLEEIRKDRQRAGIDLPLYFHSDAAQAGNYLDLHAHRLGVDLLTINGGKLYGPKQSGVLFVRSGVSIEPLIHGGGQERNLRSGTENLAGSVGLAEALLKASKLRNDESQRLAELQKLFIKSLQEAFPHVVINGSLKHRLPNNVHITLPSTDNERVLMALDMENIYAAAGSACSASHEEPSHVLSSIGLDESAIHSSLRFSMGRGTTEDEITRVVKALKAIVSI